MALDEVWSVVFALPFLQKQILHADSIIIKKCINDKTILWFSGKIVLFFVNGILHMVKSMNFWTAYDVMMIKYSQLYVHDSRVLVTELDSLLSLFSTIAI